MKVMQIANHKHVKGGITSVVNSIVDGLSGKVEMKRHPSYISNVPSVFKMAYSICSIIRFCFVLYPYQIFHIHSAANGSFYRKTVYTMICKWFGKKVIFHIHGSSFEKFHNKNKFNAYLIRKTLNRADEIIVLSKQMEGLVLSYCDNSSISILPNPVVIPESFEVARLRRKKMKIQLLFMGEIGRRKGVYDLVDAIGRLPDSIRNNVVLNICGNNELEKLKKYIEMRQLDEQCLIHGWIDGERKKILLANADIYILPSYYEGLPVSILEAMAYGLPIISTNVGGIPEIVLDQHNGYIISPGDIERLAASVEKLVVEKDLRERLGHESKRLAMKHDSRIIVKKLYGIYKQKLQTES